jgi:hypothetical protein
LGAAPGRRGRRSRPRWCRRSARTASWPRSEKYSCALTPAARGRRPVGLARLVLVDVDQVDVRRHVELARAELAHADDPQLECARPARRSGAPWRSSTSASACASASSSVASASAVMRVGDGLQRRGVVHVQLWPAAPGTAGAPRAAPTAGSGPPCGSSAISAPKRRRMRCTKRLWADNAGSPCRPSSRTGAKLIRGRDRALPACIADQAAR